MEHDVSDAEARYFLASSDVWGERRLYGVIGSGECAGQLAAIKSVAQLEARDYSRLYLKGTTFSDLIRKA